MIESLKNMCIKLLEIGKVMKIKDDDYLFIDMNSKRVISVDTISFKYVDISQFDEFKLVEIDGYNINKTIYSQKMLKTITNDGFIYELFIPNIGIVEGGTSDIAIYNGFSMQKKLGNIIYQHDALTSPNNIISSYISENVQDDSNFMNVLALKSADGAIPFIVNPNHIVMLFNGLIPVLKSDKVNVEVNDFEGNYDFFEAKFIVIKKKYIVTLSMNCLYI